MPIKHRPVPQLPERARVHPISQQINRSYSVGRENYSRVYHREAFTLTLTTDGPLPDHFQANLVTSWGLTERGSRSTLTFSPVDERTLACVVTPDCLGFHSFRADLSLDGGVTWVRDDVPDAWVYVDPAHVDDLRLYTIIPTVSGTLADWKADLPRIGAMGFNAVHLLPITPLDTSESPYAARDLFGVDPSYLGVGTSKDALSQLEEFVEAAKALSIRLCFDLVLNHVGENSTMSRRAPDWIMPDPAQPDGFLRAGYWCEKGWLSWNDLILIHYKHPSEMTRSEIWTYMTEYALFWAKFANDTGGFVRFDNLHSSDVDFVEAVTTAVHRAYPEVGVIAEYFTDEETLVQTAAEWGLNLVMATPWNYKFVPDVRNYLGYLHSHSEHIRYYMPITSHDSGAPAQEFETANSTIPRYVAAALLGAGATGIPQGVELGEQERLDFMGRQPKKLFPAEPRFARFLAQVNAILAENPAFRRGGNCHFVDNDHPAIIAAYRLATGTQAHGFLVVCNFDTHQSQSITVDLTPFFGPAATLYGCELLSGMALRAPRATLDLLLPSCAAQVFQLSIQR